MSVQQENEKKSCPSRGLGIAAAAIGVGIGAALYYYFSKRQEPDNEGATTSGWNCEQPHTLSDTSFTTVSEHSTTDTSINDTSDTSINDTIDTDPDEFRLIESSSSTSTSNELNESLSSMSESDQSSSDVPNSSATDLMSSDNAFSSFYNNTVGSETDTEWDVTNSSIDVPSVNRQSVMSMILESMFMRVSRPKTRQTETEARVRQSEQVFQERSWAPEECAICFDMMSTTQNLMALPCTHRFHRDCILTWLQEKQTCPVCRKEA